MIAAKRNQFVRLPNTEIYRKIKSDMNTLPPQKPSCFKADYR